MSATTDEISIDLDALEDKKDPEIKVLDAEDPPRIEGKQIVRPEDGLEKLKKQLDDEKSARIAAEQRANDSAEAERLAKTEHQGTQLDLVTNAIASVTQANDILESKLAEALSAQDYTAAAKINREMSSNAAKLLQLEDGKTALEKAPKPQIRQSSDPLEEFVSRLSPKSGAWVREHPEYVRDANKNRKMLAAHEIALADGNKVDTQGYFDSIENTLGLTTISTEDESALSDAARPVTTRSKAAPAAAPVTRSGTSNGSRSNTVTLSPDEREIAKMNGMTDQEYAVQKMALKKEGRLN